MFFFGRFSWDAATKIRAHSHIHRDNRLVCFHLPNQVDFQFLSLSYRQSVRRCVIFRGFSMPHRHPYCRIGEQSFGLAFCTPFGLASVVRLNEFEWRPNYEINDCNGELLNGCPSASTLNTMKMVRLMFSGIHMLCAAFGITKHGERICEPVGH